MAYIFSRICLGLVCLTCLLVLVAAGKLENVGSRKDEASPRVGSAITSVSGYDHTSKANCHFNR